MNNRLLVAIVLIPIGAGLIVLGGPVYAITASAIVGVAAWEYDRLLRMAGLCPARWLVIGGSLALALSRAIFQFRGAAALVSLLVLVAMTHHLLDYERGRDRAASDFGATLGGIFYLGWLGAYLISLRSVPSGSWWVLTVLPVVWLADAGAMVVGMHWGRHPFAPRLSPHKTWEGYFGGVASGTLAGALLGGLWGLVSTAVNPGIGALVGLALSALTPLGDLGESMIKRQVGVKDSSQFIPGHGGVLDRIDSWLWAGVIGYYLAVILK
jgi:phosphatidate cytidylyltransferase